VIVERGSGVGKKTGQQRFRRPKVVQKKKEVPLWEKIGGCKKGPKNQLLLVHFALWGDLEKRKFVRGESHEGLQRRGRGEKGN